MSTGGAAGYNPEKVLNQDKSDKNMLEKLKDAIKPTKHTSVGPTAGQPATGVGEAHYSGSAQEDAAGGQQGRVPQEGAAMAQQAAPREGMRQTPREDAAQVQGEDNMPSYSGMRHQGRDTSSGILNALKPGTGASDYGSGAHAVRETTNPMTKSTPGVSKKLQGGLGSDPGSVGYGNS
ncbi:hypothetical protein KJ359_004155 [Pestalotiopsis sp. 9143b]|nr:hypothetical protein KJ359_004155 [Pestalotiopsis sp. 9143b]